MRLDMRHDYGSVEYCWLEWACRVNRGVEMMRMAYRE